MSRLALITYLDGRDTDPGYGVPAPPVYPGQGLPGAPAYPSHGLPGGGGHPGNALPGGGYITTLPVYPFDPTVPSNELPGEQPEAGNELPRPGKRYIVKWLACAGLILVPDNTLPETPEPK